MKCPFSITNSYLIWSLISSDRPLFPSGGDDCPTLSRLPLRPHRVLGLPPAVRLPSGWIWGRPPSRSRRRPIFTSEKQGGAERRGSQEEGQESRVGRRAALVKLHPTRPHHGLHMTELPIPFQGKGQFDVLPSETLSIRAKMVLSAFYTARGLCKYHSKCFTLQPNLDIWNLFIYVFVNICAQHLCGDPRVGAAWASVPHQ